MHPDITTMSPRVSEGFAQCVLVAHAEFDIVADIQYRNRMCEEAVTQLMCLFTFITVYI